MSDSAGEFIGFIASLAIAAYSISSGQLWHTIETTIGTVEEIPEVIVHSFEGSANTAFTDFPSAKSGRISSREIFGVRERGSQSKPDAQHNNEQSAVSAGGSAEAATLDRHQREWKALQAKVNRLYQRAMHSNG